jgi:hypothetical protein
VTLLLDYRRPPPKQKALRPISAPRADIERRARFFYDDLLALFNCSEQSQCYRLPSGFILQPKSRPPASIQLLAAEKILPHSPISKPGRFALPR